MRIVLGMVSSSGMLKSCWKLTNPVPVVAIFMKFDDLITQVFDRKKDKRENIMNALDTLEKKFKQPLSGYKFHPCAYVCFEGKSFVIQ
jgi:hypothetical protein